MPRRYAIIGTGMMGCEHLCNAALLPDVQVVALADPDRGSLDTARTLAERLIGPVDAVQHIAALLDRQDIDAFIVAAPNHTHYTIARMLMRTGKAILLEKPMCTTEPDAVALCREADTYSGLFWVGLEYRFMPPVTAFIERVHTGPAGPVKMLTIREHRFPFLPKVGDWNRFNANTGGTLVEKCCHFFDLMRHILRDEPVRVYASGGQDVNHLHERYDGRAPDILDNAYVIVDFAGGARAVLDLCMFAEGSPEQEEIYAVGPHGKWEVKIPSGMLGWHPRDRQGTTLEHVAVPAEALAAGSHHGATYYQLRRFDRALDQGLDPDVSALDGLRSVQMGLAAQHSIETGQPVALDFLRP